MRTTELKIFTQNELKNCNLKENVKVEFEKQTAGYLVRVSESHYDHFTDSLEWSSRETFLIWRPMTENQVKKVINQFFESHSHFVAEIK